MNLIQVTDMHPTTSSASDYMMLNTFNGMTALAVCAIMVAAYFISRKLWRKPHEQRKNTVL